MILDFIMAALLGIFSGILALFPEFELPGSMSSFGASIGSTVSAVNGVFPVVTLGACILAFIVVSLVSSGIKLVSWLYEHVPFKFT